MNYPVWQLDIAGGGLLIAMIAILHVYIAHFAVGGGLFLVLTEMKGVRENNKAILDYVWKHTRFFILVTMVLGALTGVGIWFTISVLAPAATSKLIHLFLFAWSVEWLFFLTEILSLFVYYKTFDKVSSKTHITVGWIYAIAAILSLFVINGIIDFMLTPGSWIETGSFWAAFFNPTFWPAFFFRTFLALMIAGLFGFMTSTCIKDDTLRIDMVRYCAKWLLIPFVLFIGAAFWYKAALPPQLETFIFTRMPGVRPFISAFTLFSPVVFLGGLFMAIKMPAKISKTLAVAMLIVGVVYIGLFEFIREGGRKPYIIYDHMYSNSIMKSDVEKVAQRGVLQSAKWVKNRVVTDENILESGREVYNLLCLSCHSIGGPFSDMQDKGGRMTPASMEYVYKSMGKQRAYMPPFVGTEEEKRALNYFLSYGL